MDARKIKPTDLATDPALVEELEGLYQRFGDYVADHVLHKIPGDGLVAAWEQIEGDASYELLESVDSDRFRDFLMEGYASWDEILETREDFKRFPEAEAFADLMERSDLQDAAAVQLAERIHGEVVIYTADGVTSAHTAVEVDGWVIDLAGMSLDGEHISDDERYWGQFEDSEDPTLEPVPAMVLDKFKSDHAERPPQEQQRVDEFVTSLADWFQSVERVR